jgi:hypothetical protein
MRSFKVQVILSLAIATFCMVNIGAGRTEAAFWSTLSGIIGYWLPTPTEK